MIETVMCLFIVGARAAAFKLPSDLKSSRLRNMAVLIVNVSEVQEQSCRSLKDRFGLFSPTAHDLSTEKDVLQWLDEAQSEQECNVVI